MARKNTNSDDEEKQDPLEAMDEADDDEEETDDIDPEKLKKKGLHIEGDDDIHEPIEVSIEESLLEKDPLLPDVEIPDDEEEVDLEDEEFSDGPEW